MKRREFITLGGAAAVWPLAAHAQQPPMPVIGWLSGRTAETDALVLPAFRRGLNAQGYVEGRNVTVEYRWADGQFDRMPALAADLVRRRVAVIAAISTALLGTRAIQIASSTTPVVFATGTDPVTSGLVPSLNRPGGNITGITSFFAEQSPKRLELLHALVPRATTIAVLVNPTNGDAAIEREITDVQEAARTLGLQIKILNASTEHDLDAAFASLAQLRADALFVTIDPFFFTRARQIVAAAARHAIPATYFRREIATAGGLMSYGSNTEDNYRVVGDYTGRILKGAKAGDLPVQQPTKFEFVINLQTARTLGIMVPPRLLATADEVIE